MRKRCAFTIGMMLALFVSSATVLAADPPAILAIRQLYQEVNDGMESGELASMTVEFGSVSYDGIARYTFITGARNNDNRLRKVIASRTSGSVELLSEFLYYPDGTAAFHLYRAADVLSREIHHETRHYFQGGRLIRYMDGKEICDGPFSKTMMSEAARTLEQAAKFKKAFESMPDFGRL